jgi:hypothetical protein
MGDLGHPQIGFDLEAEGIRVAQAKAGSKLREGDHAGTSPDFDCTSRRLKQDKITIQFCDR